MAAPGDKPAAHVTTGDVSREWAKEGTGTAYDISGESLPLGPIPAPIANVSIALQHVAYHP